MYILEDLYTGNVRPGERSFRQNSQYSRALAQAVEAALSFLPDTKEKKDLVKKTDQRVFQALRIDVNSEFEALEAFLEALPDVMAPGGRIAILTFHSDRLRDLHLRSQIGGEAYQNAIGGFFYVKSPHP